ncbi:GerMN domain-containing protein [Thermobrachium celere]|uniref:GerMN domain-containing protein n=1 Tax=Thermobrachium celere DSM 8682 TaxID=941824 RepID=R7RV30_9CLOT|nr:GerMN domain-containing protein [Thermobrachium celere]CDF59403.1 hypothetical protein TCEL_00869 [Thermobrachium celere DSM 8682]
MKKWKMLFMTAISSVLILSSCAKTTKPTENKPNEPTKLTVKDLFPFNENVYMKYQGIGNEFAEHQTYVDYIAGDRIQIRDITPGTTLAKIYEIKNGELRLISSREEYYYRENLLNTQNTSYDVLLKEPIENGTSWTTKDGLKRYISNTQAKISTPSGEYTAVEVITEGNDYKLYDYYVKELGHVKTVFKTGSTTIETNLEKIEKNVPYIQTIKFYYPDFNKEKLAFKEEKISLKTNENIDKIIESYLKNPPKEELNKVFSKNTKINKLYLNNSQNKVYIDVSKEFVQEMNAGSSLESMILQSLVNTLGNYYNVDKVYISVEGKPYESGHIAITENEVFYVDYKNVYEIK